jgi:hypothetical protein
MKVPSQVVPTLALFLGCEPWRIHPFERARRSVLPTEAMFSTRELPEVTLDSMRASRHFEIAARRVHLHYFWPLLDLEIKLWFLFLFTKKSTAGEFK